MEGTLGFLKLEGKHVFWCAKRLSSAAPTLLTLSTNQTKCAIAVRMKKITVLGCGASGGVPLIGPIWGNCDPNNSKNRRRRASILIETEETRILVDASPDCRAQLLDAGVSTLNGVIFTHAHADHCHGIDDLRWVNQNMGSALDIYCNDSSYLELSRRFAYAFEPFEVPDHGFINRPVLVWQEVDEKVFQTGDIEITVYEQDHGYSTTLGLRFGSVAYSTDVVSLDDHAFEVLEGIETWFVGCLREEPHPTHANLETVLSWVERLKPKKTILTHMNHMLDYDSLRAKLPEHIIPAYDGFVITNLI